MTPDSIIVRCIRKSAKRSTRIRLMHAMEYLHTGKIFRDMR